jgi:AcrR family transcriptional regulator
VSPSPGRPRDPRLDGRIREAAAVVYAGSGWSGFNFDIVAREAGVGKSAVYRRWASREDLLIDAIRRIDISTLTAGHDSVRDVCHAVLKYHLEWWEGTTGAAYLRLQIDQVYWPFLGALYQARVVVPLLEAFRIVVRHAIAQGDLPPGSSATLLVEALSGMSLTRMAAIRDADRRQLVAAPEFYLDRAVDFLLAGVSASARTGPTGDRAVAPSGP